MSKKSNTRGLRGIGIRRVVPNQINFKQAISGSLALTQITTPSSVPDGLGQIYFKSDGKLYFKSDKFEETDLTEGNNGLSFSMTSPILSIESDPTYGDTDDDGGDWPSNFTNGPFTTVDISVPGTPTYTTNGHDFTHSTNGGNPGVNTYIIDASRAVATTDRGTVLTTTLTGHDDDTPIDFTINFSNGVKSVLKLKVTLDSSNTKLTLNNLSQYENVEGTNTFSSVVINVPFKVNVAGSILTVTRTITVQKIRTGLEGTTARAVNLTATKIAFLYDGSEVGQRVDSVTQTTITANKINTVGTVYYEFLVNGVRQQTGQDGGNAGGNHQFVFTAPASLADMPKVIECRIREVNNFTSENTVLARDQITVIGVKEGSGAYQVYMPNNNHNVPATRGGDGSGPATTYDMTDSNPGFIAVFKGGSRLVLHATNGTPSEGEFSITSVTSNGNPVNITNVDTDPSRQTASGNGQNKDAIFDDHGGMRDATNGGIVTYVVNCEDKESIPILQSVTKSVQGTKGADGPGGSDGRTVEIAVTGPNANTTPTVTFDELGNFAAGVTHPSIEFTATARNLDTSKTISYVWTINDAAPATDSSQHSLSGTGNNVLTYNVQNNTNGNVYNDYDKKIEVEVKEDGTTVARDQVTLIGLKPGEGAYKISMPNDNTTVISTETNNGAGDSNIDYSTTNDVIRVFRGATQLTPIAGGNAGAVVGTTVTPGAGQFTVKSRTVTPSGKITPGALTLQVGTSDKHISVGTRSAMTSDSVNITYIFNCEGISDIPHTVTVAKSKEGLNGQDGAPAVDLEIDPAVVIYDTAGNNPDVSAIELVASTRKVGTEIVRSAKFGYNDVTVAYRNATGGISMSATNQYTIAFWIKLADDFDPSTAGAGKKYIFREENLMLSMYHGHLALQQSGGGLTKLINAVNFFNKSDAGKWTHVVIGRSPTAGSSGEMFFSKNGQLQTDANGIDAQLGGTSVNTNAVDSVFYIGNYDTNDSQKLPAELSNFIIYDQYISIGSGNVEKLYNSGKVHTNYKDSSMPGYNNIVVWYKLDEDQGTTTSTIAAFNDSSGRSKHLSIVNTGVESISNPGLFAKAGPSYFTFKVAGTVVGSANQTFPYVSYTSIPSTFTSFAGDPKTAIVEVKVDSATAVTDARDQGQIVAINPGSNAPVVVLDNPVHYFSGNTLGAVSSYTNSGTDIQVFSNGVLLTALTSAGTTPVTDSGTFKLVSITVEPSNIVVAPLNTSVTVHSVDGTNDALRIGNFGAATVDFANNTFSLANNRQQAKITYNINVEGQVIKAVQNLIVNTPGAQGQKGDTGLGVGLLVRIDNPLVVVQTDRFGTPLANALDGIESHITVIDTTADANTSFTPQSNSNVTANGKFNVQLNSTLSTSGGHTYPGGSLTIAQPKDNSATGQYQANIQKLATMTADALVRVFDVKIRKDGIVYTQQIVQQIVKAVADVESFGIELSTPVAEMRLFYSREWFGPANRDATDTFSQAWDTVEMEMFRNIDGVRCGVAYDTNTVSDNTLRNTYFLESIRNPNSELVQAYINWTGTAHDLDILDSAHDIFGTSTKGKKVRIYYKAGTVALGIGKNFLASFECTFKFRDSAGGLHTIVKEQMVNINIIQPQVRYQDCRILCYWERTGDTNSEYYKWKTANSSNNTKVHVIPMNASSNVWQAATQRRGFFADDHIYFHDKADSEDHSAYVSTGTDITWTNPFVNREWLLKGSLLTPKTDIMLTGISEGYLFSTSLAHPPGTSFSNKSVFLQLDLFITTVDMHREFKELSIATELDDINLKYLGSFYFDDSTATEEVNRGRAQTFNLHTNTDDDGASVIGIVPGDNFATGLGKFSHDTKGEDLMVVPAGRTIVPVLSFTRGGSQYVLPNAGFTRVKVRFEYIECIAPTWTIGGVDYSYGKGLRGLSLQRSPFVPVS